MKPIQNLFLFVIVLSSNLVAQDSLNKKKIIIKTDIALPIIGVITSDFNAGSLTLELGFKRRHSIQLTGSFFNQNNNYSNNKTIQMIPAYKFFLIKNRPYSGFYTGLYLKGAQHNFTHIINSEHPSQNYYLQYKQTIFGGGIIFGYQNYICKRIVIDALIGFGARQVLNTKIIKVENTGIDFGPINTYRDAILALNIGYKF